MSPDQRANSEKDLRDSYRELQRKQQEVQDDFNARRNEEMSRLQKTLIEQVRIYAKAQNFDLVIADGVIYTTPTIDITPAILTQLQAAPVREVACEGTRGLRLLRRQAARQISSVRPSGTALWPFRSGNSLFDLAVSFAAIPIRWSSVSGRSRMLTAIVSRTCRNPAIAASWRQLVRLWSCSNLRQPMPVQRPL